MECNPRSIPKRGLYQISGVVLTRTDKKIHEIRFYNSIGLLDSNGKNKKKR